MLPCNVRTRSDLPEKFFGPDDSGVMEKRDLLPHFQQTAALCQTDTALFRVPIQVFRRLNYGYYT